ncbi:Glutamate--cysteine ligase regulatory subunit [Sergentomyia squamirostris]
MSLENLQQYLHVVINTGNVLSVNKKAGQKPSEELVDCLKATLDAGAIDATVGSAKSTAAVSRSNDDLREKVTEHERANVKIGAKLFLNTKSPENLKSAIETLFEVLGVTCLDNLILAYHPEGRVATNGVAVNGGDVEEVKEMDWTGGQSGAIGDLKALWKEMEQYALDKKIFQLGIADLDVNSLKELYNASEFHPSIAQINISTCCVVPPPLQEFCHQHDIQLLTHSDPEEILTRDILSSELNVKNFSPMWTMRFQVHVKCRGVLAAKGYVVGASKI